MRIFSRECRQWAEEVDNASDREIIMRVARMWLKTASAAAVLRDMANGFSTQAQLDVLAGADAVIATGVADPTSS